MAVIAFQIILCLFVGCVGISIIWCAMLGWMVLEFTTAQSTSAASSDPEPGRIAAASTMFLDLVAIIYYAVNAPTITTVAHLLAILMGMILEVVTVHRRGCRFIGVKRRFGWEVTDDETSTPLFSPD
jgi:hypothetical protein